MKIATIPHYCCLPVKQVVGRVRTCEYTLGTLYSFRPMATAAKGTTRTSTAGCRWILLKVLQFLEKQYNTLDNASLAPCSVGYKQHLLDAFRCHRCSLYLSLTSYYQVRTTALPRRCVCLTDTYNSLIVNRKHSTERYAQVVSHARMRRTHMPNKMDILDLPMRWVLTEPCR